MALANRGFLQFPSENGMVFTSGPVPLHKTSLSTGLHLFIYFTFSNANTSGLLTLVLTAILLHFFCSLIIHCNPLIKVELPHELIRCKVAIHRAYPTRIRDLRIAAKRKDVGSEVQTQTKSMDNKLSEIYVIPPPPPGFDCYCLLTRDLLGQDENELKEDTQSVCHYLKIFIKKKEKKRLSFDSFSSLLNH